MAIPETRWKSITPSAYAGEQDALNYVRERLVPRVLIGEMLDRRLADERAMENVMNQPVTAVMDSKADR